MAVDRLMMFAKRWWAAHLRGELPTLIRLGRGVDATWPEVGSLDAYLRVLEDALRSGSEAHSLVNPGAVLGSGRWISKLIFELDADTLEENYSAARALARVLIVEHGTVPRTYFSGHRSFHIYTDFDPVPLAEPADERHAHVVGRIMGLVLSELRGAGVEAVIDESFRASKHLSRVPFTRHPKTGLLSIPVDLFSLPRDQGRAGAVVRRCASAPVSCLGWAIPEPSIRPSAELHALVSKVASGYRKPRRSGGGVSGPGTVQWIEELLERGVQDGRHRLLWRVVAPYLVNVRRLSRDEAAARAREWLDRCAGLRPLSDRSLRTSGVRYYLENAGRSGLRPASMSRLLEFYPDLREVLGPIVGRARMHAVKGIPVEEEDI